MIDPVQLSSMIGTEANRDVGLSDEWHTVQAELDTLKARMEDIEQHEASVQRALAIPASLAITKHVMPGLIVAAVKEDFVAPRSIGERLFRSNRENRERHAISQQGGSRGDDYQDIAAAGHFDGNPKNVVSVFGSAEKKIFVAAHNGNPTLGLIGGDIHTGAGTGFESHAMDGGEQARAIAEYFKVIGANTEWVRIAWLPNVGVSGRTYRTIDNRVGAVEEMVEKSRSGDMFWSEIADASKTPSQ